MVKIGSVQADLCMIRGRSDNVILNISVHSDKVRSLHLVIRSLRVMVVLPIGG